MLSLTNISNYIDEITPSIVSLSKVLHQNAELSEYEFKTSSIIQSFLKDEGISYESNVAGQGVVGRIKGQDTTKGIGIRADIDALPIHEKTGLEYQSLNPGVMHACGHDIHTAILLGTSKVLQNYRDELPYSVSLFFQPSEETIGGAHQMIEAGCLKKPDINIILGLHVDPSIPAGSISFTEGIMNAASSEFEINLKGVSSHAAHPHKGNDTIIPACQIALSLPSLIKSKIDPTHPVLVSIGKINGGVKNNIIADETIISGIIRTFSNEDIDKVKEIVNLTCNQFETLYNISINTSFENGYPVLINNSELFHCMLKSTSEVIGESNVIIDNNPTFGTDDFSFFGSDGRRAIYYNLGVGNINKDVNYPIHSQLFSPDLNAIKYGILSQVWGVISLMENNII